MSGMLKGKLSEFVEIISGGTPKTTVSEFWDGDIPWISISDFIGDRKHIFVTEKTITKTGLQNSSTRILTFGDSIISARGTVGEVGFISKDMAFNQSCYGIRARGDIDKHYLYYLLVSLRPHFVSYANGAVFNTITRETFDQIEVLLPPLEEQERIAGILSAFDDKIELNRQMNQTLEAIAQAIFKEWFVDFRYPGATGDLVDSELGPIPRGWHVGKLGDIVRITKKSLNPSAHPEKIFTHFSLPAFDNSQTPLTTSGKTILSNKFSITDPCILFSKLNPTTSRVWRISKVPINSVSSTEFFPISTRASYHYFIYCVLKRPSIIRNLGAKASGTSNSHQRIRENDMCDLNIKIPDEFIVDNFNSHVHSLFEMVDGISKLTQTLTGSKNLIQTLMFRQ